MKTEKDKFGSIEKEFFDSSVQSNPRNTLPKYVIVAIVVGIILVLFGTTYALFTFRADLRGNKVQSINTCSLDLGVAEKNPIELLKAYPMSDSEAASLTPYEIEISNNGGSCKNVSYTFRIENLCTVCGTNGEACQGCNCDAGYQLSLDKLHYQVVDVSNANAVYTGTNPSSFTLTKTFASNSDAHKFLIRLWIGAEATNEDVYVYGENGKILETSDGRYVTKNYCSKVQATINAS